MRIGVISDIHGNLIALEAVLEDMPEVDAIVCAGDVVGYGPWPAECVAMMRDRDVPSVMGNHDRAAVADTTFGFNSMAAAGVAYAQEHLDESQLAWLRSLPTERHAFDDRVKIVHGHPDDPDKYTYPDRFSARLLDGEDVLVMGHTHVQAHEEYDSGVVMNPGSVGQPRDGDPRAAYAVVDIAHHRVQEYRVEYDIDSVVAAVRDTGLPDRIGTRLYKGR